MRVAIALGSNLGDRAATIREATHRLSDIVADLRVSSYHETAAVGVGVQPPFLNAAAVGESALPARAVLDGLLALEMRLGRTRPHPGAARTIDLDLILYGDTRIDEPGLSVPHPRFRDRRFVLAPLAEIAADWRDPVTGLSVQELLLALHA